MNVAQVLRRSLFDADAVNLDSTTARFFTETELLAWANDGKDTIEKGLHQADEDYNLTFLKSTDASFRWEGELYTPPSFKITAGTRTYTLPPNLIKIRSIRPAVAGTTRFEHLDISHPYFRDIENRTDITNPVYWDIVGNRTLVVANPQTLEVELGYVARSPKLRLYSTGTWSVTQNSTAVVGVSSLWVINELSIPAEFIGATDVNTPKIASQTSGGNWVDPAAVYNPISVFLTDTTLTLAGPWLPATVAAKNYLIASVPNIPFEYHLLLVDYVTAKCLEKGNHPKADAKSQSVAQRIMAIGTKISEREESAGRIAGATTDRQPGGTWAGIMPGGAQQRGPEGQ